MKGRVKFFNVSKAFGFITGEDGKEYYVREGSIQMDGLRLLLPDWEVEFTPLEGKDKGPLATEVKPLELSGLVTHSLYDTIPGWGMVDLVIALGDEVLATLSGLVAVAEIEMAGLLRAYRVSGRVDGFNFTLPAVTPERAFVLLDPQKNPLPTSRDYKGVAPGSYLLMLHESTGEVSISNLGRRYQPDQKAPNNWAIIERRFYHKYDLGLNAPTIREQTPLSGMQRDNDGFVAAIEAAVAYSELARTQNG